MCGSYYWKQRHAGQVLKTHLLGGTFAGANAGDSPNPPAWPAHAVLFDGPSCFSTVLCCLCCCLLMALKPLPKRKNKAPLPNRGRPCGRGLRSPRGAADLESPQAQHPPAVKNEKWRKCPSIHCMCVSVQRDQATRVPCCVVATTGWRIDPACHPPSYPSGRVAMLQITV